MYGLARLRGIGGTVSLGDRRFTVRGRTLGDYAELEARMLELRGDPFHVLRWLCREASLYGVSAKLVERLRTNEDDWWSVTIADAMEWLSTLEGRVFGLWLAIRYSGVSLEWVQECFVEESEKAEAEQSFGADLWWQPIQTALDLANGEDELSALENFGIEEEKSRKTGHPNWRLSFRDLCVSNRDHAELIGLSPESFWNLTLRQYQILIRSREALAGKTFERESLMLAHNERQAKETEKAMENLKEGKRWNAQ